MKKVHNPARDCYVLAILRSLYRDSDLAINRRVERINNPPTKQEPVPVPSIGALVK